jgi:hypothetical protein
MTTASGQFAYAFSGSQNPFSNANFTDLNGTSQLVASGYLTDKTGVLALMAYNGNSGAYDGSDVTAIAEVNFCGTSDSIKLGCLDESGNGYIVTLYYWAAYAQSTLVDGSTLGSFTADDLFAVTVTKGSPNHILVTQNGADTVGFSPHTHTQAGLGNMRAVFGQLPNNLGNEKIKSVAVNGISVGGSIAPLADYYARMRTNY